MVMVYCHITLRIDRRQLMLRRRNLIMLCLCRHADLPQLLIDILHESRDSLAYRSKIMVIQLLPLRRHCAEQGTSCIDQILPLQKLLRIHQKIFLLRSYGRRNLLSCLVTKQAQKP